MQVPCASTIRTHLAFLYKECKEDLIELLADHTVSFTTDLWTGVGARAFITVTAHYISREWKYRSVVLATRQLDSHHTGKNIADALEKIQREFKIRKLAGLTTDNASNMKVAGSQLGIIQWPCFSHTLQLAISEGLKIVSIKKALSAASTLVAHFNKSSKATTALKEKQVDLGDKPKCLIQSVCTRWNSEFFMAQRLIELRLPMMAVLLDEKITKTKHRQSLDMNDASWKVIEDIIPVLRPFAQATEALTKEDTPTLGQVFVLLRSLVVQACRQSDEDSKVAANLKRTIKNALMRRFHIDDNGVPDDLHSPAVIAMFLDPRYKNMSFLTEVEKSEVSDYVSELVPTTEASTDVKQETGTSAQSAASSSGEMFDILACLKGEVQEVDLTCVTRHHEIQQYLAEPVRAYDQTGAVDPLEWWKVNEKRFPALAKLAKFYLSIPATEVASERMFSTAGLVLSKLRSQLEATAVDQILFLHKNYNLQVKFPLNLFKNVSNVLPCMMVFNFQVGSISTLDCNYILGILYSEFCVTY